jgi:parallel beta-helix repeat protein
VAVKKQEGELMRRIAFILLVCAGISASMVRATVIHVPSEHQTIQAGIDAAVNGDTVLVADGIYTDEGNENIDFNGKAILLTSENGPEVTIIDCKRSGRGFHFHCFEDTNSVVRGFTIRNARIDWDDGAGIYCYRSSPKIVGNIITGNKAGPSYSGGGICCSGSSMAIIEDNIIVGNEASHGAGVYCYGPYVTISNNIIAGNRAKNGGGVYCIGSSPIIYGNRITGNTAGSGGGGIQYVAYPSLRATIGDRIIPPCFDSGSDSVSMLGISYNIISGNSSSYGGGISCIGTLTSTIVGNVIKDNTAMKGGGIYCCESPVIINANTIARNDREGIYATDSSSPTLLNSIIWENTRREVYLDEASSITVTYSDIEGGSTAVFVCPSCTLYWGEGNIDADPLFLLPEHHDLRLLWGSPCIDAGHPDSLDPDGTRRDMGAFTFDQEDSLTVYLTPDTALVFPGDELGITYTLINRWPEPVVFWLRSVIHQPSGGSRVVVGPERRELDPETSDQYYILHAVPQKAPQGYYEYECVLDIPPDILFGQDSFRFYVSQPEFPAKVIRVPADYPTIQKGIDAAQEGDTVLVAPGKYSGTGDYDIDFKAKAIKVISEEGPAVTIIDCQRRGRGFFLDSHEDSNSVVKGFTIMNGFADYGGGIYCGNGTPRIEENRIMNNTAERGGGGILCPSATIVGNLITGNVSQDGPGGGIWAKVNTVIERNLITGNTALGGWDGGGMYIDRAFGTVKENIICGNTAREGGGILFWDSKPSFECNTIVGNTARYGGGGIKSTFDYYRPSILNSIIWGNNADWNPEIAGGVTITYSDIRGGWEGEGNIGAYPRFVLPEEKDFRLLWRSPCIDSGHPDSLDPDGTRRDMGAFYLDQSFPITVYLTPDSRVVHRMDTLGVTYTVINIDPEPRTIVLWSDLILPSGEPYPKNPIYGPEEMTMGGEEKVQQHIAHPVPGKAPFGMYTYASFIDILSVRETEGDHFEFTVKRR